MNGAVTLAALAAEAAIGYPRPLYGAIGHPVGGCAAIIDGLEARWNAPAASTARRRALGIGTLLIATGAAAGLAAAASWAVDTWLNGSARLLVLAALAVPGLAQRSLYEHVAPVARALAAGDLAAAQGAVARIVGRDTAMLDDAGVARAGIESLAESFNDGIVAPAFWLALGGLPGLYAYKAVNTADSMIGHREPRYAAFGWAAARADDLLNLVPARLAGLLICLSAGRCAGRGFATMLRFAPRHASPNSGWPEAAMAGALGVRLGGPVFYDGVPADRAWLAECARLPDAGSIRMALRIYLRSCALLWIVAGAFAWVR